MNSSLNSALILNVDDTDAARYAKTRILTRAGFSVIEAANGTDALLRARQDMPNLVLLDVKLPDINGLEVCRLLKQDPVTQGILVLQTSASYLATADKIRALEGGADNYLFEPIEPEELIANVRALLRLGRVERELREVDRRKDIFLATLAHELRNPLAPIRSAVELLCQIDPDVPPLQARARQIILRQTDHMVRLVDDLLDVSRITSGKIVLKKERLAIRPILTAATEIVAPHMQERSHTLTLQLPSAELWVDGDSVRLAQVIGNLLHNAAKFTPEGGEITLSAEASNDRVLIRVEDNGIGLAAEHTASVFDMFAQAPNENIHDGLGIGLSLAKGLVELHGGVITVSSLGHGQGSTFQVALPLAPACVQEHGAEDRAAAARGGQRRVLLVDDNIDIAEMMCSLLELQGYVTEKSHTGADALSKAASFKPEVVVLDIGLPDASGFDIARELRARQGDHALLLIALTGYGRQEDREQASGAGFDLHLTKPVSIEALADAIADRHAA